MRRFPLRTLGLLLAVAASGLLSVVDRAESRPSPDARGPEEKSVGPLVVVGGGGTPDIALATMLSLTGETDPIVVVCAYASSRENAAEGVVEMWKSAGAKRVFAVPDDDAQTAGKLFLRAHVIWLSGGDQNQLMERLRETKLDLAIQKRHREGAVVGGTSAGAAVMSASMITGDESTRRIEDASSTLGRGLGLWPGVIVDQHFVERRRTNRLIGAGLKTPTTIGIGIDEKTAVVVRDPLSWTEPHREAPEGKKRTLEVIGESGAFIVDLRSAEITLRESAPPIVRKGRFDFIPSGESFTLGAARQPDKP